jgi:hypothetical protein
MLLVRWYPQHPDHDYGPFFGHFCFPEPIFTTG